MRNRRDTPKRIAGKLNEGTRLVGEGVRHLTRLYSYREQEVL